MSEGENVKVAVRVRPFNKRERERKAKLIVEMTGNQTILNDPDDPKAKPRKFAFDFSYWSHDGAKEDATGYYSGDPSHPNGSKFCDQKTVFNDLGKGILKNAWNGFNSTLFAYGQTGAGKSWSVVGYGVNKGIVPMYCDTLFNEIEEKKKEGGMEFEVQFSMLEIYMEEVRDLLNPSKDKGGLKIRQHPKKGFYAEGLKTAAVANYKHIEAKMEEGTKNRTVASTNMNATSSRAHTIVGITFMQKFKNAAGQDTTKSSVVNLVDLAGSERAESTGATGDRLKEGAAINQSLSALGNVIGALADRSEGKRVKVPFRDSSLTKLLKNALGGNSKTIMIAAISPADINFEESLGTLRYADRAKQIKCKAVVNEDPTEKLIRELKAENEKLKKMLEGGGVSLPSGDEEDADEVAEMSAADKEALRKEIEEDYKAQLEENDKEVEELKKSYEEKLKQATEEGAAKLAEITAQKEKQQTEPHMYNINFDPQLSGKIVHFFDTDIKKIGNSQGDPSDIVLHGPNVLPELAVLTKDGDKFFLEMCSAEGRLLVNGHQIKEKTQIHHNDRLMFGQTQMFVACIPKERDASKKKYDDVQFEMFQVEIARAQGLIRDKDEKTAEEMIIEDDLADLLPAINEANAISQDLDMKTSFGTVVTTASSRGEHRGRKHIMVRVEHLETEHEFFWGKEKFLDRQAIMGEMYEKFENGEDWKLPPEKDPFYEDLSQDVHFGSVKVWTQSLAYNIESIEQLEILDYGGDKEGLLNVELVPCSAKGKEYTEKDDMFVDTPEQLIGKDVSFLLKINSARNLHSRMTDVYAKYQLDPHSEWNKTKALKDTRNPDWKFKKQHDFKNATQEDIEFLKNGAIIIQLWGKQKVPKEKKKVNTKDSIRQKQEAGQIATINTPGFQRVDTQKVLYAMQLATMTKKAERAEHKVAHFRKLIELAENDKKPQVSLKLLKDLMAATTSDEAEKCYKMLAKEKGGEDSKKGGGDRSRRSSSSSSDDDDHKEKKKEKKQKRKKSHDGDIEAENAPESPEVPE